MEIPQRSPLQEAVARRPAGKANHTAVAFPQLTFKFLEQYCKV